MKNLIKAIEAEQKKRLEDFIFDINQIDNAGVILKAWRFTDLLPKGKKPSYSKVLDSYSIKGINSLDELKAYLIDRKQKKIYKSIEREVDKIKTVFNTGELISAKISMEWKRSRTWGSNPTAECWYTYKNENGELRSNYVKSGSIGGCGYDKGSTAVAECLNQINEVLKPLYTKKDKAIPKETDNRKIFGYGSGYGILPSIEGGVGVSCYPAIFESIGYKFETIASGKTFDVYTITKL